MFDALRRIARERCLEVGVDFHSVFKFDVKVRGRELVGDIFESLNRLDSLNFVSILEFFEDISAGDCFSNDGVCSIRGGMPLFYK